MIQSQKERQIGIDLLRIILAVMVVLLHINAGGTGKVLQYANQTPWKYLVGLMTVLCYPAVNCYVMITGYFSWKNQLENRKILKKLVALWMSLVFFSVFGYLAVCIIKQQEFEFLSFLKRLFPLIRGEWWFMSVYFALILIIPYINKIIQHISMNQFHMLLIISSIITMVVPMINQWEDHLGVNYGYTLIWFFVLYISGAYISKYEWNNRFSGKGKLFFSGYILLSVIIFILPYLLRKFGIDLYLNPYNSVFTYCQAVLLFVLFCTVKQSNHPRLHRITYITPYVMASYLFHCQEDIEPYIPCMPTTGF